jgi:hypothetical protein
VHIAGCYHAPGRSDTDLGLSEIRIFKTYSPQHGTARGPLDTINHFGRPVPLIAAEFLRTHKKTPPLLEASLGMPRDVTTYFADFPILEKQEEYAADTLISYNTTGTPGFHKISCFLGKHVHQGCFRPVGSGIAHNPAKENAMKTWSIVAVEVSMAATGIGMICLMVVVSLF